MYNTHIRSNRILGGKHFDVSLTNLNASYFFYLHTNFDDKQDYLEQRYNNKFCMIATGLEFFLFHS